MEKLNEQIGLIGGGNMARAILGGMLRAGLIAPEQAIVSDVAPEQLGRIRQIADVAVTPDNAEVVRRADVVFFATKPFQVDAVCAEIRCHVRPGQLFVTICAGIPTEFIGSRLGDGVRVVRVMPNTPSMIGCGAAGVAPGKHASAVDIELVTRIFSSIGKAIVVEEDKLDLVTGLTGSGPAYVYYFAEAMIAAGRQLGLDETQASVLVKQLMLGSARMILETDKPLDELRKAVATKGGTTEAGLRMLEEGGFPGLLLKCVIAATNRSRELSKTS